MPCSKTKQSSWTSQTKETKMSVLKVKTKKDGQAVVKEVTFATPNTLQDFVDKYGEEQALNFANRALVIDVQNRVRLHIDETDEQVQAMVDSYQPGVRGPRTQRTPLERAQAALSAMSVEDIEKLLSAARAKAQAAIAAE